MAGTDFICVYCQETLQEGEAVRFIEECQHFCHVTCQPPARCPFDDQHLDLHAASNAPSLPFSLECGSRFERLREKRSHAASCRNIAWILLHERNKSEKALLWLNKAIKKTPPSANALLDLADWYERGFAVICDTSHARDLRKKAQILLDDLNERNERFISNGEEGQVQTNQAQEDPAHDYQPDDGHPASSLQQQSKPYGQQPSSQVPHNPEYSLPGHTAVDDHLSRKDPQLNPQVATETNLSDVSSAVSSEGREMNAQGLRTDTLVHKASHADIAYPGEVNNGEHMNQSLVTPEHGPRGCEASNDSRSLGGAQRNVEESAFYPQKDDHLSPRDDVAACTSVRKQQHMPHVGLGSRPSLNPLHNPKSTNRKDGEWESHFTADQGSGSAADPIQDASSSQWTPTWPMNEYRELSESFSSEQNDEHRFARPLTEEKHGEVPEPLNTTARTEMQGSWTSVPGRASQSGGTVGSGYESPLIPDRNNQANHIRPDISSSIDGTHVSPGAPPVAEPITGEPPGLHIFMARLKQARMSGEPLSSGSEYVRRDCAEDDTPAFSRREGEYARDSNEYASDRHYYSTGTPSFEKESYPPPPGSVQSDGARASASTASVQFVFPAVGKFRDMFGRIPEVGQETVSNYVEAAKRLRKLKEKIMELQERRESYWHRQAANVVVAVPAAVFTSGFSTIASGSALIHQRNRLEQLKKCVRDIIKQINEIRSSFAEFEDTPEWKAAEDSVTLGRKVFGRRSGVKRSELEGGL